MDLASGLSTGLATPEALSALGLSLAVAVTCGVLNGVFGVAGAVVLVRQRFAGRKLLDALVDLPLGLSPVMTGLGFLLVFGRRYSASIPIRRIRVATASRPPVMPSARSRSRSIRLPAKGCSRCNSSIRRMMDSRAGGTGPGR